MHYQVLREIDKIIPDFLSDFIKDPMIFSEKGEYPFSIEELENIKNLFVKLESNRSNVELLGEIFNDTLIIGDTHGFLDCTIKIIKYFLEKEVESLIFLGDYVDRGPHSLLNLILVVALKLAWPERIIILKGNHEDLLMNERFGFGNELKRLYPRNKKRRKVEFILTDIYDYMPLAVITPKKSIALHAGIPHNAQSIYDIKRIPKPHSKILEIYDPNERLEVYKMYMQIRWNDPREGQLIKYANSWRGKGVYFFNKDATINFLENSGCNRIIRAHESSRGSFDLLFKGKLIHIFSAEPYFDKVNKAYIIHEEKGGNTFLRDLDFNKVKEI